jgi:hypothetical protein
MILYQKDIVRIRDVYIKGEETLKEQDKIVHKMFEKNLIENHLLQQNLQIGWVNTQKSIQRNQKEVLLFMRMIMMCPSTFQH